jgi:hypothetical protein
VPAGWRLARHRSVPLIRKLKRTRSRRESARPLLCGFNGGTHIAKFPSQDRLTRISARSRAHGRGCVEVRSEHSAPLCGVRSQSLFAGDRGFRFSPKDTSDSVPPQSGDATARSQEPCTRLTQSDTAQQRVDGDTGMASAIDRRYSCGARRSVDFHGRPGPSFVGPAAVRVSDPAKHLDTQIPSTDSRRIGGCPFSSPRLSLQRKPGLAGRTPHASEKMLAIASVEQSRSDR